jgi:hypothetical protein
MELEGRMHDDGRFPESHYLCRNLRSMVHVNVLISKKKIATAIVIPADPSTGDRLVHDLFHCTGRSMDKRSSTARLR